MYVSWARKNPDGSVPAAGFRGSGNAGVPDPGLFGPTDWQTGASPAHAFCPASVGTAFVADFSRDGRDDVLCHSYATGRNWIAYANGTGGFDLDHLWADTTHEFCRGGVGTLRVGDVSGDGQADLVCHDPASGHLWIAYGAPDFGIDFGALWSFTDGDFCRSTTGALSLGDVNGDGKADLVCHNYGDGRTWVAYTNAQFRPDFTNMFSSTFDFCSGSGASMRVADLNGDGRDDLVCHSGGGTGSIWAAYTNTSGQPVLSASAIWSRDMRWCNSAGEKLLFGKFDGNQRDDTLCHSRARQGSPTYGYQYVVFTRPGGVFAIQ